jgi:hypothetical protein
MNARLTSFVNALTIALKAPNFGARGGQVITGNLARGADGKFVRADGSVASGTEVVSALTARPKKGGAGKGKLNSAAQAKIGEKAGIDSEDFVALEKLSKGTSPSESDAQRLVNLGLAERGKDGTLRMASNARALLRATQAGDVQAAKDALSKGRDKAASASEQNAKRAARDNASQNKRAATEQKRSQQQAQRKTDELDRVADRIDEIEAVARSDKNITEPERVRRENQLDALSKRLDRVGADANDPLRKRIERLRNKLSGASDENVGDVLSGDALAQKEFAIFKSSDGWRWLGVSSNAYQDKEREIVSTKALEEDAKRMSATSEYGPLRWWHVGAVDYTQPFAWETAKAGVGVDIGTCDFSTVVGRMAIEGGTINSEIAQVLKDTADDYQMSRGFAHPPNEPVDGVYYKIKTFERSLLPRGKAANPFTAFQVNKERDMATMKEKIEELAKRFFGGDSAKAEALLAQVQQTDKELGDSGVAFKSDGAADSDATNASSDSLPADGQDEKKAEDDSSDDVMFVGDYTIDELVDALAPAIASALSEAMKPTISELETTKAALHEAQKELNDLKAIKIKEADAVSELDKRVKQLEGDAPGRGYRATSDDATVTHKSVQPPQVENDIAKLAALFEGVSAAS